MLLRYASTCQPAQRVPGSTNALTQRMNDLQENTQQGIQRKPPKVGPRSYCTPQNHLTNLLKATHLFATRWHRKDVPM
eukprot:5986409-Amphidinium_carterae.1